MAKVREFELMSHLLQMIEWDRRARYGKEFDTWYRGMHWRDWMDADVRDDLASRWGHFDAVDSSEALLQTT